MAHTHPLSIRLEFTSSYDMLDMLQVLTDHVCKQVGLDEDALHDLGAFSMISSDSQAMGRVGEVVTRTWQTAHKSNSPRPPTSCTQPGLRCRPNCCPANPSRPCPSYSPARAQPCS